MYGDFPLENSVFLASLRFVFDAFLKEIALLQRRMIKNAPKARRKILGSRIPEFGQILEILASDLLSRGGLMGTPEIGPFWGPKIFAPAARKLW